MKSIILKIAKNIAYQLIAIFIIIGGIAFASFSWPTNSPSGETSGGKIMTFINNIISGCTIEGEFIEGYQSNGIPICSKPEGSAIIPVACGISNGIPVAVAPTTDLCDVGTSTTVTTSVANFTWSCNGSGGDIVNCSAARKYTVTFNGNGGNGHTPTTKSVTYNTALGTLPSNPTRTGYTFNGWYTATSGGTKITTNTLITGATTFYAQWSGTYVLQDKYDCVDHNLDGEDELIWLDSNNVYQSTAQICVGTKGLRCGGFGAKDINQVIIKTGAQCCPITEVAINGYCVPYSDEGGYCYADNQCKDGLDCYNHICVKPKCGVDLYESSPGVCSPVGIGYYSPTSNNNRYSCTNYTDSVSRDYTYTSDGNGTNSCTASYTPKCGIDLYESSEGVCSAVGIGYYSPNLNNTRSSCTNKTISTMLYTTDGNGSNSCSFACPTGYSYNATYAACVMPTPKMTLTQANCNSTGVVEGRYKTYVTRCGEQTGINFRKNIIISKGDTYARTGFRDDIVITAGSYPVTQAWLNGLLCNNGDTYIKNTIYCKK